MGNIFENYEANKKVILTEASTVSKNMTEKELADYLGRSEAYVAALKNSA